MCILKSGSDKKSFEEVLRTLLSFIFLRKKDQMIFIVPRKALKAKLTELKNYEILQCNFIALIYFWGTLLYSRPGLKARYWGMTVPGIRLMEVCKRVTPWTFRAASLLALDAVFAPLPMANQDLECIRLLGGIIKSSSLTYASPCKSM